MSRCQPQIICTSTLQHIINQGSKLAKDNQTIRKHLFNYSNLNNLCITNQLVQQSGAKKQSKEENQREEEVPQNIRKDQRCNNSVGVSPSRKDSGRFSKFGINNRDTTNTRSPRLSRRSSAQTNRKIFSRNRSERVDGNKFIDLSDIIDPPTGKIVTQAMKNQNKRIEELRQKRQSQQNLKKKQQKHNDSKQKAELERMESLKNKLNKHLRQKNNTFSFDLDGNYMLIDNERQHVSLRKKYPPSNLKFEIDHQQDPNIETHNPIGIKQKAARGQAFASAVLKTMNMSKFSLNLTSKTCNIDQFAFMKRNDLFNNNHSRQVTTIPYLQVSQGTNYTETHTNLSVGKKTQRTMHSQNKSKFKTHQLEYLKDNTDKHNNKTQCMNIDLDNLEADKRRIQSSRPYMRPKTSYVPKTAKTTDRITSVNQHLVCELIE